MLSANEQIINFFILLSAGGSGRLALNFPPAQSPGRCTPLLSAILNFGHPRHLLTFDVSNLRQMQ
jgi:hypothetical protein